MKKRMVLVAAVLALAGAASAADVDLVQVGVPGRNETKGFAPRLYVRVEINAAYQRVGFDGDHGTWTGPDYSSPDGPTAGGKASIDWTAYFDHLPVTQAAKKHLIQGWPVISTKPVPVPHVVRGEQVGILAGVGVVSTEPGSNAAQFETAVAFPLCRGLVATVEYAALAPPTAFDGFGHPIQIGGSIAREWNQANATNAFDGVTLVGDLPIGKVTAKQVGHLIRGKVFDCARHEVPGALVNAGPKTPTLPTTVDGSYALYPPAPGLYVVKARSQGGTVTTTVRVH